MNVRRSLATAVLLLAVPALSSCGVNFDAQTEQVYNPAVGVNDQSGVVDVLNALVVSGSSGSGTLVATLVNGDGTQPDALRSVAGAREDSGVQVTVPGTTAIPAGGLVNLAETPSQITVRSPKVVPGFYVRVTFTFDRAGAVTLNVPVVSADLPPYDTITVPGS
ncbi:MAG: hypothetical protein WB441_00045 [Nocardioidaceae bacterium]